MSLNEMIYQNYVQNMQQYKQEEEHESSESTTTNETSSSNLQSDVSVVESEIDERHEEEAKQTSDEEDEDEQKQELPSINQLYQQNMATAQMLHLINSQKQEKQVSGDHEKENAPICKYCNKIFANVSNLNHHISAIHLNQSKWICSQCGKICSSKSNLKVHLRVHLRVKPYHCRWCSYSCMHHSSIRDHLAKVHPDKTHTPLQPGYLFNSQAVPEPEVFNSQGFNANTFTNDQKSKRSSTEVSENGPQSPEKTRNSKKMRMEKQTRQIVASRSPVRSTINPQPVYPQIQTPPQMPAQNLTQNPAMSNLYNAYMARMLPFMYNPLQQYAAAVANNQQHSSPTSQFLGMLNQNFQFGQGHQSRQNFASSAFSSLLSASSGSSSSDEQPTNSSGNYSYSGSSRSSSMSPSNKVSQHMSTSTSTDEGIQTNFKILSPRSESINKVSSAKKTLSIEQMLSTKVTKETQTESSCLSCPYCSGNNSN